MRDSTRRKKGKKRMEIIGKKEKIWRDDNEMEEDGCVEGVTMVGMDIMGKVTMGGREIVGGGDNESEEGVGEKAA